VFFWALIIITILIAGGYTARHTLSKRAANAADSTADSTAAAKADEATKENGDDEKKEPDPVPVEVSRVIPRSISSYYYTTATLDPEKKVDVLAKLAGQVVSIFVEEGDIVRAGQPLCKLEDDEQRISLEEARINRDKQQSEYDRIRSMFDQKLISDKEFSDTKYRAELAQAQFAAARLRYEHTEIRSPFDGVVTKRYVDLGQNVGIGNQIFEVADPQPLLVRMYLPENEVRTISIGQAVHIEPDNSPGRFLSGRVVRIAPEVDERTGTVKVTAETNGKAMPGSFARIRVVTDTHDGSLTIPRRSVVSDAGETFVYIAVSDTVRKTPVRIGYQDQAFAEIIDGVEEGDSIVVVGTGGLRTGTKIKILEPTMQQELGGNADEQTEPASN
jgi:membrane fusion protein (multidrug efflux system)